MVFRHRRVLCLSLFTVLAVALAGLLPHTAKVPLFLLALLAVLGLIPFVFRHRRLLVWMLVLLLLALSLFSSYLVSGTQETLSALDGEKLPLTATVLRVTDREDGLVYADGTVRLSAKGGERTVNVKLKIASEEEIRAGDMIRGEAVVSIAQKDSYIAAKGFYASLRLEEVHVVGKNTGIRVMTGRWSEMLSRRLVDAVPGEGGALYAALLLGDREGLSEGFTRDMTRIGTVHILSVSGMHLVILTAGLGALLRKLRLGKHLRFLLLAAFAVFFMLLTGLSSSVLRAGLMFLFSVLPAFLREERDSLSSLSVAVAIILLLEPYAVRDLALWLSALSTLGILLFFDRQSRTDAPRAALPVRLLRAVGVSFAVTLSAMVATLPFSLILFESLPLLSPVSNLLLSPLVQAAMYISLLLLPLGGFPPLKLVARLLAQAIFSLAALLSRIPKTALAIRSPIEWVLPLGMFLAIAVYFLFCPRKRFRLRVPLALLVACALTLALPPVARRIWRADGLAVTYYADIKSETDCIYMETGAKRLLIPFSDFSATSNAEEDALSDAADELDALFLPYYTEGSGNYLISLLSSRRIRHLYLPSPRTAAERRIVSEISLFASQSGTRVTLFPKNESFSFEGITVSRLTVGGNKELIRVSMELAFGESVLHYYSGRGFPGPTESTPRADLLIFGCFEGEAWRRYPHTLCVGEETRVLSPAMDYLPLDDASGAVFSDRKSVLLRKSNK